ncbi:hypothetical protein HZS_7516 [Henneguya salminicola]|uniref:U6 snRNA-associated Sm-like protein LSm7 (Trinotate prediction) n=1 Tax=Henneguya salminicola TaxID=69463 RepID=A0A6G3MGT7_HENSL|nr:hypothetical protein HZS_7516 [Henneguya salminicola]
MAEKRKKDTIIDMNKFIGKKVHVKFNGGREGFYFVIINTVEGTVQGTDTLINLVLDDTIEFLRDPEDPLKITDQQRSLGLVICRGSAIVTICPSENMQPIENPFVSQTS